MKLLHTILLVHVCVSFSWGQIISKLDYSRDSINLGEQTAFIYEISIPANLKVQSIDFSNLDSLQSKVDAQDSLLQNYYAEVEWSENLSGYKNKTIPINDLAFTKVGINQVFRDTFYGTFWDFGIYIPENPKINYSSNGLTVEEINVQNKMLLVTPPQHITNPDTTQLILPIEDILEEPDTWKDYLPYIYILTGIILLSLLIIFIIRSSRQHEDSAKVMEDLEPIIPPQVLALSKLEALANEQLW
ncbi:MAG: hypothetical protein HKN67_04120, partial [Saprospiraceae bacterium]|nr:hypothetical protein [Saprospiraceae bacterium]